MSAERVVIPFPSRSNGFPTTSPDAGDGTRALLVVICALHALGEPATARELCDLISQMGPDIGQTAPEAAVIASLRHYSREGNFDYFRPVSLLGEEAWAFTRSFREVLANIGLTASLREVPE